MTPCTALDITVEPAYGPANSPLELGSTIRKWLRPPASARVLRKGELDTVIIDGRIVVRGGRITTFDEQAMLDEIAATYVSVQAKRAVADDNPRGCYRTSAKRGDAVPPNRPR